MSSAIIISNLIIRIQSHLYDSDPEFIRKEEVALLGTDHEHHKVKILVNITYIDE